MCLMCLVEVDQSPDSPHTRRHARRSQRIASSAVASLPTTRHHVAPRPLDRDAAVIEVNLQMAACPGGVCIEGGYVSRPFIDLRRAPAGQLSLVSLLVLHVLSMQLLQVLRVLYLHVLCFACGLACRSGRSLELYNGEKRQFQPRGLRILSYIRPV